MTEPQVPRRDMQSRMVEGKSVEYLPEEIACLVGRICHKFSDLEQLLKLTIYELAGVSPVVGRIAIGTGRAQDQIHKIGDLLTERGIIPHPADEIKDFIRQAEEAQTARDLIVHGVWIVNPDGRLCVLDTSNQKWSVPAGVPRHTRRMYPAGLPVTKEDLTKILEQIQSTASRAARVYERSRTSPRTSP